MAVYWAAALLVAIPLALELTLRGMGLASFPLFEATPHGSYRTRAFQAGLFRRSKAWRYDANGQRNDAVPASFAGTTLLVGDSIVDGGVRVDQSQTLAAVAMRLSGEGFYCVGCHGWSLANSVPALRALPGWTDARRLVFVLNTGDFDDVGFMANELSFPTRRPAWLTLWLVQRQLLRRVEDYVRLPGRDKAYADYVAGRDWREVTLSRFEELLAEFGGPVYLVRYPKRGEDARGEPFFEQLAALDPRVRLIDAADAQGWSTQCYADRLHPNVRGIEVLADHLCRELN